MAATNGSNWVTSLRLAPVRMTASGMPWASVMRWCLEPGRARSVGFGPVFDRRPRHEWKRNRQCSATSQSGRQGAVVPAAKRANGPRPRLPARPEAVASNSCQNHNPVPWAAFPRECRSGAQTRSPPEPHDHPVASVLDTWLGAAWAAARAGRSAPTTRHRESIYPFPLHKKTAQRLTKFSRCEQRERLLFVSGSKCSPCRNRPRPSSRRFRRTRSC